MYKKTFIIVKMAAKTENCRICEFVYKIFACFCVITVVVVAVVKDKVLATLPTVKSRGCKNDWRGSFFQIAFLTS